MPIFGLQPRCQGRLSLIRHLKLIFDDFPKAWDDVEDQGKRTREQGWSEFLQQNRFTHGIGNVCFEYLETLELDFSEWGAIRREDLTVRSVSMFFNWWCFDSASHDRTFFAGHFPVSCTLGLTPLLF